MTAAPRSPAFAPALAGALALACALAGCAHADSLASPGGRPATGFALDLSGRRVALESMRGKVVLLDFFATWCEPCKGGLPVSQALVEKHAARGLAGWAVSLDDQLALVGPFVAGLGLRLPALFDEQGRLADELGVEKLPTVVVLDRQGAVRFLHYGASDADGAQVAGAVEQLLREK